MPAEQQAEIFQFLLLQQWGQWEPLSRYGTEKVRLVAKKCGLNWDTMTEAECEEFIDNVVHN